MRERFAAICVLADQRGDSESVLLAEVIDLRPELSGSRISTTAPTRDFAFVSGEGRGRAARVAGRIAENANVGDFTGLDQSVGHGSSNVAILDMKGDPGTMCVVGTCSATAPETLQIRPADQLDVPAPVITVLRRVRSRDTSSPSRSETRRRRECRRFDRSGARAADAGRFTRRGAARSRSWSGSPPA